jgi:DNA-binding HxlR family transcriptional regulator
MRSTILSTFLRKNAGMSFSFSDLKRFFPHMKYMQRKLNTLVKDDVIKKGKYNGINRYEWR